MAGGSILIVEDEAMVAMMLEDFLEELGYAVHGVAATLEEGLAATEAGGFDAALVDCNLHGEKSWPIAYKLTEKHIRFAFVSGGSGVDTPTDLETAPALSKPFTMDNVRTMLDALLTG